MSEKRKTGALEGAIVEGGARGELEVRIASELLERAKAEGVSLVCHGGLLAGVTRQVLQAALEAEMAEHLGYERGEGGARAGLNMRNGTSPKTLRTEVGDVQVRVPRDRDGSFEPVIVPKHARWLAGFDEAVDQCKRDRPSRPHTELVEIAQRFAPGGCRPARSIIDAAQAEFAGFEGYILGLCRIEGH